MSAPLSSQSATHFNENSRTDRILRIRFVHFCVHLPSHHEYSTGTDTRTHSMPTIKSMHCVSIYLWCRVVLWSPVFTMSSKIANRCEPKIVGTLAHGRIEHTFSTHSHMWCIVLVPIPYMRSQIHMNLRTHQHTVSPGSNQIFIKTTHAIGSTL